MLIDIEIIGQRFFEELRKDLADHVFDSIEQVEGHLTTILQKYYQNPQVIIQLTQYPLYIPTYLNLV